jgi:predicted RNase H-like HicB family nuclease
MDLEFDVIIEEDEDGYFFARVPELHGCHTQAPTIDLLMERVKEVIELCLEDQGIPERTPRPIEVRRVKVAYDQNAAT